MKAKLAGILFLCLTALPEMAAQSFLSVLPPEPRTAIPENVEIRRNYRPVIEAGLYAWYGLESEIRRQRSADLRVRVRREEQGDALYLLFLNEEEGRFPLYSSGSWIIKRDKETGRFLQAKIFLNGSRDCFVRLFPSGDRTRMDIHFYGKPYSAGTILPIAFTESLFLSFREIQDRTRLSVDWEWLFPEPEPALYRESSAMVREIRRHLPNLQDADDGAQDSQGRYVLIATGEPQPSVGGFNCSGFAKWVADGIYRTLSGSGLGIPELKKRQSAVRGNSWTDLHESVRDPFFGLDWTRNIACSLYREQTGLSCRPEDRDVRAATGYPYREDVGYPVEELPLILYRLALTDPGHFYMGSVNIAYGEEPVIRQHIHVALFFPYFDEEGRYRAVVMERNLETNLKSLEERYPGSYVHLVRLEAQKDLMLYE